MPQLPLRFDAQGLIPAILQDHLTGQVRMFAYATEAAVRMTLQTGLATFWSRSRGELWQRGRISGHETPVVRVLSDCNGHALIYSSDPHHPTCNSGAPSCFFHTVESERLMQATEQPQTVFAALESILDMRKKSTGGGSYTKGLYDSGAAGIAAKFREEAGVFAKALESENDERVVSEAADTLYHVLVGLRSRSITLRRVLVELARRVARSNEHAEPADRESRGTLESP
jgi:phosphoribosyl-ATP pyrophosphohydrolase/phosphoribosyl-AMP cyclohydrolase